MGRHTYFPSSKNNERRFKASQMAGYRGKVAIEWFDAGNKLTPETKPEFDRLMKQADKDWKEGKNEM
jgi:coproporphyrinogen III oxidase